MDLLSQPWRPETVVRPHMPKSSLKILFGIKVMFVWWNFEGVIHWEFDPNGRAVDADLYSQQLEQVHEIFRCRYWALVNRNRVILQQNNARPHIARTTMAKIQELAGIELLSHPAYSPHLAPSDYHLFPSMAHFLHGRNFENTDAVQVVLTEFFAWKPDIVTVTV